jgi:hypothetical protein
MQEMLVFQGALIPLKYENCYLARSVKKPSNKILKVFFKLLAWKSRFGLVWFHEN